MLWFVAFLIVAALSCFATAKSFMLIIDLPWYIIVPMVIVFFVFSSYAFKLIMDAIQNDGSIEHPKAKLWGGIALVLLTWVLISLPTNAHTFFFMKEIGAVVDNDITATKTYAEQLANRTHLCPESDFKKLSENCNAEFEQFSKEVKGNYGKSGFGDRANTHINIINKYLATEGTKYSIPTIPNTNRSSDNTNTKIINDTRDSMNIQLSAIEDAKYKVPQKVSNEIKFKDIPKMDILKDSISIFIQTHTLWMQEDYIKQVEGTLSEIYGKIKMYSCFVHFETAEDEKLYTAEHIETRISSFLDPYKVMGDFFTGKHSFKFIFWIILSILLDVLGFISFDLALKKEYDF